MRDLLRQAVSLVRPVFDPVRALRGLENYPGFVLDFLRYQRLPGAEHRALALQPELHDRAAVAPFDAHYLYMNAWAFREITRRQPSCHVDVASQLGFVTQLAAVTRVTYIDIRPFCGDLDYLDSRAGSVLAMPFSDREVASLSCLHVAEHVGLGRYGDPLDPRGTQKAIRELARVLAEGGRLYFGLPVGRPRLVFNAHRIHDPRDVVASFAREGLRLESFAAVDDGGRFRSAARPDDVASCRYACGLFLFSR